MNIITTSKGFLLNNIEYSLKEDLSIEILNEEQAHVHTNNGIVLFDLSITIDEKSFSTIEELVQALELLKQN